jgi:hypothetical protein
MTYLLGIPIVLFLGALIYGGITGRIRMSSSCCAPADPRKDLRMRSAFPDADPAPGGTPPAEAHRHDRSR